MQEYAIIIDLGGTMTKVVVFDFEGNRVALKRFDTDRVTKQAGFAELNLEVFEEQLLVTIRELLEENEIDGDQIVAVTCVGHGKGLYVVGEQGIIYPGILSVDKRADSLLLDLLHENESLSKRNQRNIFMSSQAPFLLKWLKINEIDVYNNIKHIFSSKDYVRFILTGLPYTDYTDASSNGFIDLDTNKYDLKLLKEIGIEEVQTALPNIKLSTEVAGTIVKRIANMTGLIEGTPVYTGSFDVDACALGVSAIEPNKISMTAGTWSVNALIHDSPAYKSGLIISKYLDARKYLLCSPSPTSAGNLSIALKMLFPDFYTSGSRVYDLTEHIVKTHEAKDNNVIFLPFLYGTNSRSIKEGRFIGLNSNTKREDLLVAIYEGIIFSHKFHLEQLMSVYEKPNVIRLAGGAANSDVWVQMFSDILGISIEVCREDELGALGGAMMIAYGQGRYLSLEEASKSMTEVIVYKKPRIKYQELYKKKYQAYLQAMEE